MRGWQRLGGPAPIPAPPTFPAGPPTALMMAGMNGPCSGSSSAASSASDGAWRDPSPPPSGLGPPDFEFDWESDNASLIAAVYKPLSLVLHAPCLR